SSGKCKQTASVPWDLPYGLNRTTAVATLTICNSTGTPQSMTWSAAGLPPGGWQCTIAGPTVFTPASGTVLVPANGCINIPITIQRPPGLTPGQVGCYQVTIVNNSSGGCISVEGSVMGTDKWCIRIPD